MKIRIKGNTLRLRLSQSEVQEVLRKGAVSECITFGPGRSLAYSLESAPGIDAPRAAFTDHRILVVLPQDQINTWATSDQVSMRGTQNNGTDEGLEILVEKDFRCLTDRPHENEKDLFPHPKEGELEC